MKTSTGPHHNESVQNNVVPLPVHSNESATSNQTMNQNISEAIWENLKYQKEISTNLKALS